MIVSSATHFPILENTVFSHISPGTITSSSDTFCPGSAHGQSCKRVDAGWRSARFTTTLNLRCRWLPISRRKELRYHPWFPRTNWLIFTGQGCCWSYRSHFCSHSFSCFLNLRGAGTVLFPMSEIGTLTRFRDAGRLEQLSQNIFCLFGLSI